ncbi:MAG: hypothetical protein A3J28_05190 [Acidobacteria bacterium RIFCSPLOWO2_12_FULL_60_22]|nr:MAG: hypothetical protein A3J28_05190 [Acidobacteria bacterium RIFCSPLOWO2_12_FULL_60_22]
MQETGNGRDIFVLAAQGACGSLSPMAPFAAFWPTAVRKGMYPHWGVLELTVPRVSKTAHLSLISPQRLYWEG